MSRVDLEKQGVELKLGDIIKITDEGNESLNNQTFFIDYIDDSRMFLINAESFQLVKIVINVDGTLDNGTISKLAILSRSDQDGYARQHDLLVDTWIDIHFEGDYPTIITGRITDLVNDMIEIDTLGDIIYINFDYKGIPLDLPIKLIEIREKPASVEPVVQAEAETFVNPDVDALAFAQADVEEQAPKSIKDQLREFIINADQIVFGEEKLGTIVQYVDVSSKSKRYSIEAQVADLLDELLSTIPNAQRTEKVLNNIHTIIERFKQLREHFSFVDEYGNIEGALTKKPTYKPLINYFDKFKQNLYWILPVVQNVKKIYNATDNPQKNSDVVNEEIDVDIQKINDAFDEYKSNDLPNKYTTLYSSLNPYFTPYEMIGDETKTTIEKRVGTDLNVIIDNLDNMYSSIFTQNNIKRRRFVIQKYNLGMSKLDIVDVKKNTRRVVFTPDDTMSIKSFVTLPEPTIRFSRINLPGTNILDRSNLNMTFLNFWQFLRKKTNVTSIEIDNLDEEIKFNEENFASNIKNYVMTATADDTKYLTADEIYEKFIQCIIPKTKIIFNLMKKYITGKLSVVDVVSYLEPFLIYSDSLTYTQYSAIIEFINREISSYNKKFSERSQMFGKLRGIKNSANTIAFESAFTIISMLTQNSEVFDSYDFDVYNGPTFYTNSEIYRKLMLKDSFQLYNSAISMQTVPLMFSSEISDIFKNTKEELAKGAKPTDTCEKIIVAKQYNNIQDLENDNNKNAYFDKRFDSTNYSLIDGYETKMSELPPEEFIEYLTNDLKIKFRLNDSEASYLVETLIYRRKKVIDNQYAILFNGYQEFTKDEYSYYIRKNDSWTPTQAPMDNLLTGDANIYCDLQQKCISTTADKCEGVDTRDLQKQNSFLNEVVNEFDEKYKVSKEILQAELQEKFDYFTNIIAKLKKMDMDKMLKYNNQKYKIGRDVVDDTPAIISPYYKIRDLILSQRDFTKKQQDIIRFKTTYTREANANEIGPLGDIETSHWLYCIKTDVKLLPTFKYELACVFTNNKDEYNTHVELLRARIGKQSDDGDMWVDKYSGWTISSIDFDTDEGYDEGFKASSRSILEENIGDRIIMNKTIKFETPESRMISNVVNAVSQNMGINLDPQKEFIINAVLVSLNGVGEKADYDMKVKEAANKNKVLPSYTDYRNTYILFCTLGMFLIAAQTSNPSIRTKRTFPGCVKSFSGYPFENNSDFSSLTYLACVVYEIRKTRSEPWNVLARIKKEVIQDKIKRFIDDILMNIPEVKRKITEKAEFLLINPEQEIAEEHNILNWTSFLPPLAPFTIKNPMDITEEFEKQLMRNMRDGSREQDNKFLIIDSKIFQFSLALQEKIQDVVRKKDVILRKSNNQPYLENACCDEKSGHSTIQYFENENGNIKEYNKTVERLTKLVADITDLSKSGTLSSVVNTKNIYPPIGNEYDERTIYLAFITFCKFKSLMPIPADLLPLCESKPDKDTIKPNDSLNEMIRKLKTDGREYSNETFLRLLQIVSRNNIVDVNANASCISSITRILGVLEAVKMENDTFVNPVFIEKINNALDTFDVASDDITAETEELNNFLITNNEAMKKQVVDFITKNKGPDIDRKTLNNTISFIANITKWSTDTSVRNKDRKISSDDMYNYVNFLKTFIDNSVNVFPNIILNKVDYNNVNVPKYWNLSKYHKNDVKKMVKDYYDKLKDLYDIPQLYNILKNVGIYSKNMVLLSKSTPCFSTMEYKDNEIIPVFDERTSKYLMEYYLFSILTNYIKMTDDNEMLITEAQQRSVVEDMFSVESVEEEVTKTDVGITDARILTGNKKQLKQLISKLLVVYLGVMDKHKDTINVSYEDILDRVFKLKEREKDIITDRLKGLTEEERNADTILKINKLGVWNKGLQKGLTSYVAENYDAERELMEKFGALENKMLKTNKDVNENNKDILLEEFGEDYDREAEIEREAYDMRGYNDDYYDGNFEGDEVENYGEYD